MIPKTFISDLSAMIDIEDFLSSYITIKKAGRTPKALCPFHNEKSPSFVIYPETQSYYCFGCGKGGSVYDFIMEYENIGFIDAVRFIANRQGIQVPDDNGGQSDYSKQKSLTYEINKETAIFFYNCLKNPAGQVGYDYLRSRGLDNGIIKNFGLGYAPDSWNSLYNHLKQKGYSEKDMETAYVIKSSEKGNYYDVFRNRVIFPIFDLRKNVIGFGGRILDDSSPKYLNTGDTPVFKKSQHLFGLNFAKKEIQNETIILCEGYMDVVAMHATGFKNSVATLGTALTSEQARLISKYANKVVVAYDSDEAGKAATRRAFNILDEVDVTSTALKIEGAKDPDEYIKQNGSIRFKQLLEKSNNLSDYELNELKEKCNLQTNEGIIEYTKKAIYILAKIKNNIEREVYIGNVASLTGVASEAIKQQVNAVRNKNKNENDKKHWQKAQQNREFYADKVNPQKGENLTSAIVEENILAFLFRNPEIFSSVVNKIEPNNFITEFNKRVYAKLLDLNSLGLPLVSSNFTMDFNKDEIASIARMIANNSTSSNEIAELDEYIRMLKEYKSQIKYSDVKNLDILDIEEYRKKRTINK